MAKPAYLALSLARLRSQVTQTFPKRGTASDGWIGDAAHAATNSDHNPDPKSGVVRALDLTATKAQADRIIAAATVDDRVAYVIYNRKIWLAPAKAWRAYTGLNAHEKHVHISLLHTTAAETSNNDWKGLKMAGMSSPIQAVRVSSEFGRRSGTLHAGIDLATGGKVMPVYAAYAGKLSHIVRGRKRWQSASVGPVVAPGRSGNGCRVNNPDGETQAYIHVTLDSKWRNGMKVKKGERLGVIDLSGNTTGYHLHFETWNRNGTVRNPRIDFNFHGVKPGEKPQASKPAPKPKPKPKPKPAEKPGSRLSKREVGNVQRALARMGYDVGPPDEDYGGRTTKAVMAYQTDLNTYAGAGLIVDGDWWSVLQNWFDWVKKLQRALPAWRGVSKLVVDGGYQRLTSNAVKTVQRNYGLFVDGKAQAKTCAFMRRHGSNIPNPPKNRP